MINRFKTHIENAPWEEQVLRAEKYFNGAAWLVILFAVFYFGAGILRAVLR